MSSSYDYAVDNFHVGRDGVSDQSEKQKGSECSEEFSSNKLVVGVPLVF